MRPFGVLFRLLIQERSISKSGSRLIKVNKEKLYRNKANNEQYLLASFDEEILSRARNGDMSAWRHIFQSVETPMYSLALKMVGNKAVAEDIVQDSFIKAIEKIHQYRGDSSFWWWLRKIVANHCISYLRTSTRFVQKDEPEIEAIINDLHSDSELELNNDIEKLMGRLSENARRVVYLYVVEGMTHQEIADLFKRTPSFSKSILSRSLGQLRKWIK